MDKLELKHIAPYLPYKIRVQYEGVTNSKERTEYDKAFFKENGIDKYDVLAPYSIEDYHPPREEKGLKVGYIKIVEYWDKWTVYLIGNKSHGLKKTVNTGDFKLILRPLSAYKNLFGKALIDLNCDLETQIQITEFANQDRSLNNISYDAYNELVKAKVDVFGLIEKGLAIDINTL